VELYGKDYRGTEKRASFATGKKLAIVSPALQPTAEESSPSVGNTAQGGVVGGTMFENTRIGGLVAAASEPQQQKPVVGGDRMGKNNKWKRPSPYEQ